MIPLAQVNDKKTVKDILKSGNFTTFSIAKAYEEIQIRTGLDFEATIKLLGFFPTFLEGDQHREARRQVAVYMADVREMQHEEVIKQIEQIKDLFVLGSDIDLIQDVSLPLWRATSKSYFPGREDHSDLVESITSLFYPTLPLRKRLEINRGIEAFINLDPKNSSISLSLLAVAALGVRPFIGSFALSIYDTISHHAGVKSASIEWPTHFATSSLKFVDRISSQKSVVNRHEFHEGERLRCKLHDSLYSELSNPEAIYGYGAHVCLGRTISDFSWKQMVGVLSRVDAYLVPLKLEMEKHEEPFTLPSTAHIGVRSAGY